jgi:hypothetical protein
MRTDVSEVTFATFCLHDHVESSTTLHYITLSQLVLYVFESVNTALKDVY